MSLVLEAADRGPTRARRASWRAANDRRTEEHGLFPLSLDPDLDSDLDDLHRLFGAVCALAELHQPVRGSLATDRALHLVLDRRPFI